MKPQRAMKPKLALDRAPAPMRQRIVDAAIKAFYLKGYHATSVREILSACGVSGPAMYNHFRSKDELLHAIYEDAHEIVAHALDRALKDGEQSPEPQLRRLVSAFVQFQATHHDMAHVIDNNYIHLPEPWQTKVKEQRRGFRRMFREVIERGAKQGVFQLPRTNGTPPGLVATIVIGDYCMRVASWFTPDGAIDAQRMGEIYADLAIRMLKPDVPARRRV